MESILIWEKELCLLNWASQKKEQTGGKSQAVRRPSLCIKCQQHCTYGMNKNNPSVSWSVKRRLGVQWVGLWFLGKQGAVCGCSPSVLALRLSPYLCIQSTARGWGSCWHCHEQVSQWGGSSLQELKEDILSQGWYFREEFQCNAATAPTKEIVLKHCHIPEGSFH